MFKDDTVFVIGAGASSEFGLPVGGELSRTIKGNCEFEIDHWGTVKVGPHRIFQHYENLFGRADSEAVDRYNMRLEAFRKIRTGIDSAESIDEYIYRYSDDPIIAEVGKLHIAFAISAAEKSSMLYAGDGFGEDISKAHNTWIWCFFKALTNGVKASEIHEIGQNITIICFNYDRCIEHYLEHALVRTYHGMTISEARDIVKGIRIIHPYGKLGELDEHEFGDQSNFPLMSDNLITWSETVRDDFVVSDMATAIRGARRIVFMGFAFANQNMQLLSSGAMERNYDCPRVYSTGYLLPREVEESLSLNINALYSDGVVEDELAKIHFQYGAKCKEFLDIHRLNLIK